MDAFLFNKCYKDINKNYSNLKMGNYVEEEIMSEGLNNEEEIKKVPYFKKKERTINKLYNKNFFLLLQGQIISLFGDSVYEFALAFWILVVTKSTVYMGIIMSAPTLSTVIISPFAGVFIDRLNRKAIIILMDFIRGIVVIATGILAFMGYVNIWIIFFAGIIIGVCGAFFSPCIVSIIPDIVPKKQLLKANSVYQIGTSGINIVSTVSSGILYTILGAVGIFLLNGLSFLLSGILEIFLDVPRIVHNNPQKKYLDEFKDGLKFICEFEGLSWVILVTFIVNFLQQTGFVLLLPLFNSDSNLGAEKYAFALGILMVGQIFNSIVLSAINIKPNSRYGIFLLSGIIDAISMILVTVTNNSYLIYFLFFIFGFFYSTISLLENTIMQSIVPQEIRGKVFSLTSSISQCLLPIGIILGGFLGEVLGIKRVIAFSFGLIVLVVFLFSFVKSSKKILNYDA